MRPQLCGMLMLSQISTALKTSADRITIDASNRDRALQAAAFLRRSQSRAGANAAGIKPAFRL